MLSPHGACDVLSARFPGPASIIRLLFSELPDARCPAIAAFAIKGYADSNRGEGRDARTETRTRPCPSRPRRRRGAASERRAREGLPRASTQTLPLDMRALWPRIHPCQPAVVGSSSSRPQSRQRPARWEQLGASVHLLPRKRAPALPDRARAGNGCTRCSRRGTGDASTVRRLEGSAKSKGYALATPFAGPAI